MPRISHVLYLSLAALLTVGMVSTNFDVAAQDKKDKDKKEVKDKKDETKDKKEVKDKKDETKDKKEIVKDKKEEKKDKKEEIKEVKKDPFKADPAQQEFKHVEKEKTFWVFAVAFGPDGKSVAAAYRDNSVKIWDLASKKDIQTLKGHPTETKAIAYLPGEVFVSTGKYDKKKSIWEGEIKIWDAQGKGSKSLKGHAATIESLALSKDGKFLASASNDQTVKIWDIAAAKETQSIKGHTDTLNSVAFSPDGKQVVTTSADKTVRVWNVADAKETANFKIVREVEVKDAKGKVSKTKEDGRMFTCAVFTSDGKKVIAGSLDGVIKIYDVEGKKEVQELKAHEGVWTLALSPDGSKFATGGWDGTIKIWDAATGKDLKTIKAHADVVRAVGATVTTVSFSPDGQSLASGSIDGTVKIWSVK